MAMSMTPPDAGGAVQAAIAEGTDDEISLLEMLQVLWEHKWLLIGSTLGAGVLAAGVTLLMPNYYTATARILPPQQSSSSASALLGQLGGLAAAAGGSIGGIRNPNDLYVGMMKSRTVADRLIERFDLKKYFALESHNLTQQKLSSASSISAGKDGIISVSVEVKDPKLAADLSNAYVEELIRLTGLLAVTEASQRRLFFERQLAKVRDNLAVAETDAREALSKGGLALVEGQGRSLIEASARLRAQITAKEVQIGAMRGFAAETNPDLQLMQRELGALRAELARVEGVSGQDTNTRKPPVASDNARKLRELRYLETLQELLVRQTEAARLDEARDLSLVQVLDSAHPPDLKSSPRRALIVVLGTTLVLFFVSIGVIALHAIRNRSGGKLVR
jgi:tyrosine-protein kinase Etk/Wzc